MTNQSIHRCGSSMGWPGTNRMAARQPSSSKSAAPSTSPSPGGSSSPARTTASPASTSGTMLTTTYCGCMSSARSRPPARWTCARRGGGDRATEAQTRRHSGPDSDGDANARDSDGGLSLPSTRFSLGIRRRLLRATGRALSSPRLLPTVLSRGRRTIQGNSPIKGRAIDASKILTLLGSGYARAGKGAGG